MPALLRALLSACLERVPGGPHPATAPWGPPLQAFSARVFSDVKSGVLQAALTATKGRSSGGLGTVRAAARDRPLPSPGCRYSPLYLLPLQCALPNPCTGGFSLSLRGSLLKGSSTRWPCCRSRFPPPL